MIPNQGGIMVTRNRWAVFEGDLPNLVVIDLPKPVPSLIFAVAQRLPTNLHQKLFDYLFEKGRLRFVRMDEIGDDGIIRPTKA